MSSLSVYDPAARQSMSIYAYTRAKLLTHGVAKTRDGRLTLDDKRLFLLFVKLERARRLADFDLVQARVRAIENYFRVMGKRAATVYAYMYVYFDGMRAETRFEPRDDGKVTVHKTYRWMPSQDEIAIEEWAAIWYWRFGSRFLTAVCRSEIE